MYHIKKMVAQLEQELALIQLVLYNHDIVVELTGVGERVWLYWTRAKHDSDLPSMGTSQTGCGRHSMASLLLNCSVFIPG